MLVEVPDPVWKTSIGNWSSCSAARRPPAPAAMMASARSRSSTPSSALTSAAAALSRARACTMAGGDGLARDGEVLHRAVPSARPTGPSAGTCTSPMESCSVRRVSRPARWRLPRSCTPSCSRPGRRTPGMAWGWPAHPGIRAAAQSLRSRTPAHAVVGALAQHQRGAAAGGQDVLDEVGLVDRVPDALARWPGPRRRRARRSGGSTTAGRRTRSRAAAGTARRTTRRMSLDAGVDVDREVEEVADRQAGAPVGLHPRRLQHVEALDDEHVGPAHHDALAGHDVVGEVGVHGARRPRPGPP